jgi:formylglycine-generating enzyme required for sulfatase activity
MSFRVFFRCVAEAVASRGPESLRGELPLGEVFDAIAADAFARWQQRVRIAYMPQQVLQAVLAPLDEVRQTARDVVAEVRRYVAEAHVVLGPPQVAEALYRYLIQLPMSVRAALRRPSDPAGRTMPTSVGLRSPQELMRLLPPYLTRFQPGQKGPGGWVLHELLSANGFGEVWLVERPPRDPSTPPRCGERRLLKFCLALSAAELFVSPALLQTRARQSMLPGFVPLRMAHTGAAPCLEYDYVESGNLTGWMEDWGAIPAEERVARATRTVRRLAQIIARLHRLTPAAAHGNLKPANILVHRGEKGPDLLVAELGPGPQAAAWWRQEVRRASLARGDMALFRRFGACTPMYLSPQQAAGAAPTPSDDVHALGVIWYQLALGDPTLGLESGDFSARLIEAGMKRRALALLAACLAPRSETRLPDAQVLADELAALAASSSVSVPEATPKEKPAPPGACSPGHGPATELREIDLLGVRLSLVFVPPGRFRMGSPEHEEGHKVDEAPRRIVTITQGFYLAAFLITQAQWRAVMGTNPSRFHGDDRPVETVSWHDCVAFCRALRERTGERFRLPTEAEWEYACRAGTSTPFSFGATISSDQANYYAEQVYGEGPKGVYREETTPVGSFAANAWGLHDMHGNVYEWCSDWYDKSTYAAPEDEDPQGARQGTARVIRGGAWSESPALCRSASRDKCQPDYRVALIGCRVVLVPR